MLYNANIPERKNGHQFLKQTKNFSKHFFPLGNSKILAIKSIINRYCSDHGDYLFLGHNDF
jgi:hypothetical protein